jgi:hypothetical protein
MALPVIFGPLSGDIPLNDLDTNFNAVALLGTIPCTVSGTNTLTLVPNANTPTISGYSNYLRFSGIVAVTNTGAVTCNVSGVGALSVYKDTVSGPVVLSGGELVANNQVIFIYDSALNSGSGGFHIQVLASGGSGTVTSVGSGTGLTGGPITGSGSLSLGNISNLNILANTTGSTNPPSGNTLSAILDAIYGTSQGQVLYRGASVWSSLALGPAATPLQAGGSSAPAYGWIVSATTASAGSNQGSAATIGNCNIVVLTSVGSSTGIILPTTVGLNGIYVCNRGGTTVNVYPNSGAQIEALGTNTASTIANGSNGLFVSTAVTTNVPTQWYRPI